MARVYLGLGSNVERERHILAGLDALHALFGALDLSPVYDCPAIGYDGAPFLNLVVGADTHHGVGALASTLRDIEVAYGRQPDATRSTPRELDIDMLTYDNLAGRVEGVELPRGEILHNAFVLRPLAELAPTACHPLEGSTYAELWARYSHRAQPIRRIDFRWRDRVISIAE
jgi:2-amino-4-hydroxy-6-hydroxymethyldihydropteridine diphosphokinase